MEGFSEQSWSVGVGLVAGWSSTMAGADECLERAKTEQDLAERPTTTIRESDTDDGKQSLIRMNVIK